MKPKTLATMEVRQGVASSFSVHLEQLSKDTFQVRSEEPNGAGYTWQFTGAQVVADLFSRACDSARAVKVKG